MSPIHEDVSQRIKESLRDVLELMRRFEETGMDQVMEDDYRSLYDLYERLEPLTIVDTCAHDSYIAHMIEVHTTAQFRKWFNSLKDRRAKARIQARIDRLELGHLGDAEPVGEGVSELRIFYGPGYRVYFVQRNSVVVILLSGGDKGSQQADIAKAKVIAKQLEV